MIVGVPRESLPGRAARGPGPRGRSRPLKAGLEVVVEAGAGAEAGYPTPITRPGARRSSPAAARSSSAADIIVQVLCHGSNDKTGKDDLPPPPPRPGARSASCGRWDRSRPSATIAERGRHVVLRRADAADDPRAEHGRALLDGDDLRLQGGPPRRRHAAAALPHADHGGGHDHAGARPGDRRRRGRPAGDRHGAAARAPSPRPTTCGRPPRSRSRASAAASSSCPIEAKDAEDARGYARAQDETFYQRQRELLGRVVAESDVVITAAVIPGKKSPVLVTREMVASMAPGSVIVDLAAERGGNCELTQAGETRRRARRHHHRLVQPGQHGALPRQPDVRAEPQRVPAPPREGRQAPARTWTTRSSATRC